MSGSQGSQLTPLAVGTSDSGDFSSWLGRPVEIGDETYVMLQASVAIASGSNGKQLATALSSGVASWVVILSTGDASRWLTAGAIPSTLVGPIASGAYFLALRDSSQHVLQTIGALTGAVVAGEPLMVSTGGGLINVYSQSMVLTNTGLASTSSGLGVLQNQLMFAPGIALENQTGIALISGMVRYRAPFRGAT